MFAQAARVAVAHWIIVAPGDVIATPTSPCQPRKMRKFRVIFFPFVRFISLLVSGLFE